MMKKLVLLSVIFALVAGGAFAADVSGSVVGNANLLEGDSKEGSKVGANGGLGNTRIEASGATEDGKFGGWLRIGDVSKGVVDGHVFWKPIDMLLIRLGNNGGDGYWGKEGVTGWMFYQTVTDTWVAYAGENVWGWGSPTNDGSGGFGVGIKTRAAFYNGIDVDSLNIEFKPIDMIGINLAFPFAGGPIDEPKSFYRGLHAQLDVNLDFANIALSFVNGAWSAEDMAAGDGAPAKFFLYYGMPIGDSLAIDFGIGAAIPISDKDKTGTYYSPLGIGLGVKFSADAFAIKARLTATLGESEKDKDGNTYKGDPLKLLFDVQPQFAINDNATVFVSLGMALAGKQYDGTKDNKQVEDTQQFAFHFNPYIQIGSEWGPKFLAGFKLYSAAKAADGLGKDDKAVVRWAVPIAINVGF